MKPVLKKPKVLVLDIETSPLISYTWGTFDQNIALNQIHTDWTILSWAAKWLGSPADEVMYMDQRKNPHNPANEKTILKTLWKLLDEADIVLGQNSKKFDTKKINARFIIHGFKPPSSYRQLDTLQMAKRHFSFTSNKLEYMTKKLCTKYTKLNHAKFSGFELWKACLAGNKEAWAEMEAYNKHDVLATEELYLKLSAWDVGVGFSTYSDAEETTCNCGHDSFVKNGFYYNNTGKYQRYQCKACGAESRDRENLIPLARRKALRTRTR